MDEGTVVVALFSIIFGFLGAGGLIAGYFESSWHHNRVEFKRERRLIELDTARKRAELELRLLEWQQTASLEDLARHRQRLAEDLDRHHGFRPENSLEDRRD